MRCALDLCDKVEDRRYELRNGSITFARSQRDSKSLAPSKSLIRNRRARVVLLSRYGRKVSDVPKRVATDHARA